MESMNVLQRISFKTMELENRRRIAENDGNESKKRTS